MILTAQQMMMAQSAGPPPGGFPVLVSTTQTDTGLSGTNHFVNMPATVNSGNLLEVVIAFDGSDACTTPAGWTASANSNDSGGSGIRTWVYRKVAAGSEGGTSVNFVTSGARIANALCRRFTGVGTGTFYAINSKFIAAANTTPNTLTPSWGALDTLWSCIASGFYANAPTQYPLPDNNTYYTSFTTSLNLYVATKEQNIATVVPSQIKFASLQYGSLFTIGIKPA